MKTKGIFTTTGYIIMMLVFSVFSSCTKTADNVQTKEDQNAETASIDEKDFSESNEDLTNVDYREFYDELSSHGEWIEVRSEEIGLQPSNVSSGSEGTKNITVSDLLGIKDAHASSTANAGMVFVWKPSVELAVTPPTVSVPVYVPYTNGQWINTDAGWYFKARTPVEETVSHYGRWVNTPAAGWLWVPGRVWAPAWVDWKQNDNYVSWAPLPPPANLVKGVLSVPQIAENNYVTINRKFFLEPDVYKYNTIYYEKGIINPFSSMVRTDGIVVINNTIINKGPDVKIIQQVYGRNIEEVKIQRVGSISEVKYSDRVYSVYNPGFKRYKSKGNNGVTISKPKSFKKFDDWKVRKSDDQESNKDENNIRKENKGNNNGNINKGNDNVKKNDGNDNVKKYNDNDNVKKNDGNDKGKKNDGNDNGKKKDDNDKGKKNDGKDNDKKNDNKDNGKGKK